MLKGKPNTGRGPLHKRITELWCRTNNKIRGRMKGGQRLMVAGKQEVASTETLPQNFNLKPQKSKGKVSNYQPRRMRTGDSIESEIFAFDFIWYRPKEQHVKKELFNHRHPSSAPSRTVAVAELKLEAAGHKYLIVWRTFPLARK